MKLLTCVDQKRLPKSPIGNCQLELLRRSPVTVVQTRDPTDLVPVRGRVAISAKGTNVTVHPGPPKRNVLHLGKLATSAMGSTISLVQLLVKSNSGGINHQPAEVVDAAEGVVAEQFKSGG